MRDKFGLDFRIVDSDLMADLRRRRGHPRQPVDPLPPAHHSHRLPQAGATAAAVPGDAARRATADLPAQFDLLIVDEAHNCAPSGRGKYATDSLRTQALRMLAPHFEHKLFLTATPHNGYPESFTALLELLDNQRFARAVPPDRKQLDAVMVRRMKSELQLRWDGTRRFAERRVKHLEVPYTAARRRHITTAAVVTPNSAPSPRRPQASSSPPSSS